MKLAEALIRRKDLNVQILVVKERILSNLVVQEGSEPSEDPNELLEEYNRLNQQLLEYVQRINRTNQETQFDDSRSIADVISEKDALMDQHRMLKIIASHASSLADRYSVSEIRNISTIDVKTIQKEADELSRQYRELDIALQARNWQVDLL